MYGSVIGSNTEARGTALSHAEAPANEDLASIRAAIRAKLPASAFAANPGQLVWVLGYATLIVASYWAIRSYDSVWLWSACALVIGLCHVSIGFIAHDVSHGSVIRGRRAKAIVESLLWAFNATPASVWNVNHQTHHGNTNSKYDTFRYFARSERTPGRTLFAFLFVPNRYLKWNPLVFQSFIVQLGMHTVVALLGGGRQRGAIGPIPNLGEYSRAARARLYLEVVLIGLLQVAVFFAVGGTFARYAFAGPIAFLVANTGGSAYIYTQHSLCPLAEEQDPFHSTSLRLPRVVDRIHSFHSHHTAHHLFPSMNSDYYPAVTQVLARDYPTRLQRVGFFECWSRIFTNDLYKPNPEPGRRRADVTRSPEDSGFAA